MQRWVTLKKHPSSYDCRLNRNILMQTIHYSATDVNGLKISYREAGGFQRFQCYQGFASHML